MWNSGLNFFGLQKIIWRELTSGPPNTVCTGGRYIPPLDKAGKKIIQEVCGIFLILVRGVDGGLLPPLSALALHQANPTDNTMRLTKQFLDYMSTQEEAVLTYHASNMVLAIYSDASYLSESYLSEAKARSL